MTPARLTKIVGLSALLIGTAVPLVSGFAGPAPALVACGETNSVGIITEGVPASSGCVAGNIGGPAIGAAPGAGTIIACRNTPGCLSNAVNNPGQILVQIPNNTVQQSQ